MCYTQGELGRARTALTRALALAHGAGDMEMVAQAENLLGHVETRRRRRERSPRPVHCAVWKRSGRWRSRGALAMR